MSSPTGPLNWGQAGNYNAVNDRLVIRGLAGPQFAGLVQAPTLAAGSALAINVGPWIAIVDCGDGTSAVIGSTAGASINETAGGASQRTDVLWADINVDGTSQWSLSFLPSPVTGRTGVALGQVVVPVSAATSAAMTITPAGIRAPVAQYDFTSHTVTAAAYGSLTNAWPIFTAPPGAGTGIRLRAWGQGTQGTTQQTLAIRPNWTGGGGMGAVTFGALFLAVSAGFNWFWETDMMFPVVGSGGTWVASSRGAVTAQANVLPGTAANNSAGVACYGSGSLTTLTPTALHLEAQWGAVTGAPTITCLGSSIELIGVAP